ncbi:MAG: hypothetical protein KAT93_07870 [Desulfuromonadales bacterium]|nr:hypothetical protein [Desulfuromonadales bacterium]
MSLEKIEMLVVDFTDNRSKLVDQVQLLQDKIELLKREYLPGIKRAAEDVAISHAALYDEIDASPDLFVKPKTQTLHGVRVGFKKEKGKTVIADEEATIRLIKKLFPELETQLIDTKEKVIKNAVGHLQVDTVKALGITINDDTDEVYIKPIGDVIDKYVSALLEEGEKILKEVA